MVAEKLGHTSYRELSELNLQSSSVRFTSTLTRMLQSEIHQLNKTGCFGSLFMFYVFLCFRMVDLVPADLFVNLRSINLEHNNLTSFSGLIFLPNIKVCMCLGQRFITTLMSVFIYVTCYGQNSIIALYTNIHAFFYVCIYGRCRCCLWTITTLSQFCHVKKFRVTWATSRFSIIKSVPVDMGSWTAGPAGTHTQHHSIIIHWGFIL